MKAIIDFEGIHGAGKTTQAVLLGKKLVAKGMPLEYISSSDKPFSRELMDMIDRHGSQDPETLFFLSLANNHTLKERLNGAEKIFVLDRYIYTDMASTYAAGKSIDWIKSCLTQAKYPDIVLLLDLPPVQALERRNFDSSKLERGGYQRGNPTADFIDYQTRLREAYLTIAKTDSLVFVLDGRKTREEIHGEVMEILEGKLKM